MNGETIEIIANEVGLKKEVAEVTARAMAGELDFFDSLIYRVSLLKGIKESKVNEICQNLPYMNGAKETIASLKKRGFTVVCFSGGFKNATSFAKDVLGYDADFSNILHVKDGLLTGNVGGEMMFSNSKGEMLKRIQAIIGATYDSTVVVGDGANDLSMFKYANIKVAFCAKPCLKEACNICLEEKDLRLLLDKISI